MSSTAREGCMKAISNTTNFHAEMNYIAEPLKARRRRVVKWFRHWKM